MKFSAPFPYPSYEIAKRPRFLVRTSSLARCYAGEMVPKKTSPASPLLSLSPRYSRIPNNGSSPQVDKLPAGSWLGLYQSATGGGDPMRGGLRKHHQRWELAAPGQCLLRHRP